MSHIPTVMVSSTFYDLRQIRRDLNDFLAIEMGYNALLSEMSSFPTSPGLETLENCRRRVERDVDILVLVIGGRYGFIDEETAKSITNLEYLTARRKGIPIYVFIQRSIIDMLPLWRSNKDGGADFSSVVDTPLLFEFVEEIRGRDKVWIFPFDTAQDIVSTLRTQFAYLFMEGLETRMQLTGAGIPRYLATVGPRALKLALEQPAAWEYRLFLTAWIEEVERRADILRDYDAEFTVGVAEDVVGPLMASQWIHGRLHELKNTSTSINRIMNTDLQRAFGPPGQAGNAEEIVWAARKLGEALEFSLAWAQRLRRAKVDEPFEEVIRVMSAFSSHMVKQLREAPGHWLREVEDVLERSTPDNPGRLELCLTIEMGGSLDDFEAVMDRAARFYETA